MNETLLDEVSVLEDTMPQQSETFFERLVGINEAATISRASKGQISRDSKNGSLPFSLDEKDQKRYKVADLYQKYGFRKQDESSAKEPLEPEEKTTDTTLEAVEMAILRTQLHAKEDTIRRMEEDIRDLRQNRDRLIDQNQRLTLLLTGPKPEPAPLPPDPVAERKPFWKKLFS